MKLDRRPKYSLYYSLYFHRLKFFHDKSYFKKKNQTLGAFLGSITCQTSNILLQCCVYLMLQKKKKNHRGSKIAQTLPKAVE